MKKYLSIAIAVLITALGLNLYLPHRSKADSTASNLSRSGGTFYASAYNWRGFVETGNSGTGSATVILGPSIAVLPDGRQMYPFGSAVNLLTPVTFDFGTNNETVTPTAVSLATCPPTGDFPAAQCVSFTGSFSFTHGTHAIAASGTFGLQEAINDAAFNNGGTVMIDSTWQGTNALLTAAVPFQTVTIADQRFGPTQYWTPIGGATAIATPTTLVATTAGFGVNGANFTGGSYTGSNTYIACIAYVDIMGQEGNCSASFTIATSGSATTDQIGFTAPAASTGAVGYTIYITLNGGSYVSAYKVPLVTQPTVVGVYPVGNGVCTLTKVETITPACAVTNANYGQTGVGAVVSALTVNTSPIEPETTTVSTTAIFVPQPNARTTYAYTPGSHIGIPGTISASLPFTVGAATASTVPTVLGTVNIQPGFMNYLGKTIEVCGKATSAASTATIGNIQFQWDSVGQNTAGAGVQIGTLGLTPATAFATTAAYTFCEDFTTTATGATATGGSIQGVGGFVNTSGVATAAAGQGASTDPGAATTASLNLADDARLNVIYLHTTGTDTFTLKGLSVKVLN